mmetsp:Transcript_6759/g.27598  ORF Transcript_6759/g.27598 Transcript_6759/m.27598 type:complete len:203 (-) Transcript_6759:481-1089(-)
MSKPSCMPMPAMTFVGATMAARRPCRSGKGSVSRRTPQPRSNTTSAVVMPSARRSALMGCDDSTRRNASETTWTTLAEVQASVVSSVGSQRMRRLPSFRGSVPETLPERPGPCTTTPHLCSVAYRTDTECSGQPGRGVPSSAAHSVGPSASKLRSARRRTTTGHSSSTLAPVSSVAKLHLNAISPGAISRPAPRLSNAPRPT